MAARRSGRSRSTHSVNDSALDVNAAGGRAFVIVDGSKAVLDQDGVISLQQAVAAALQAVS